MEYAMQLGFKPLLPLLLLFALPAAVKAQFTYATNNGTITITYPSCADGALAIPSMIDDLPVSTIGANAFEFCGSLTNIVIPNSVTSIGAVAFWNCTSLTSVTIGTNVTDIGDYAFGDCTSLSTVTIPNSVTTIGTNAFENCTSLTSVTNGANVTVIEDYAFWFCTDLTGVYFNGDAPSLGSDVFSGDNGATVYYLPGTAGWGQTFGGLPTALWPVSNWTYFVNKGTITVTGYSGPGGAVTFPSTIYGLPVTTIGANAFEDCTNLTSVTIGSNITSIRDYAFWFCTNLTGVYFKGNAPSVGSDVFYDDNNATVYYLPGTTGWSPMLAGCPTLLWNPQVQTSRATFGVQTNQFGFNIIGTPNLVIVVEASTDLANPIWSPVGTNTLTDGSSYFSDPQWTNFPARFYRLRSP